MANIVTVLFFAVVTILQMQTTIADPIKLHPKNGMWYGIINYKKINFTKLYKFLIVQKLGRFLLKCSYFIHASLGWAKLTEETITLKGHL